MINLKVPLSVLLRWYSDHREDTEISNAHKRRVVFRRLLMRYIVTLMLL